VDVLAELHHLHAFNRDHRRATQHVEQLDPEIAREAFVDHFERRHATANDAVLRCKVVRTGAVCRQRIFAFGNDIAAIDARQQGVNFVL